jgi:hypothetical protein
MSTVAVYSYTHSVTYVIDNMLKSLKDIIRLSGLSPERFVAKRALYENAMKTWIESKHLEAVHLEIYNPITNELITRWDLGLTYAWSNGDGTFFTDTDQLRFAIKKAGVAPGDANYSLLMTTSKGAADLPGWTTVTFRSTDGMVRQSIGSTIEHSGLGAATSYFRRA